MVWVGIAGWVDGGDLALIEKQGGRVFSASDVHKLGAAEVIRQALEHAMQGCEELYLSIDIDAMDAGYLPGTGSIVHSGITPRQYYDLLDGLAEATGVRIAGAALRNEVGIQRERIDQMVADNVDHQLMVTQLESLHDAAVEDDADAADAAAEMRLKSGDEIAAEIQEFLRGQPDA